MSSRFLPLLAGMFGLVVVVMSLVAWAIFGGAAGSQRGLIIHSEIDGDVTVQFEDGRSARLERQGRENTFVVKRDEFPQTLRVMDRTGAVLVEQRLAYAELAEAEFRLSVDRNGFYATTELRTPAP